MNERTQRVDQVRDQVETEPEAFAGPERRPQARPAGEAGLDLSLGHIGTSEEKRPWTAVCDACQWCLAEADYLAAEKAAGPTDDPRCPRPGCGVRLWSFHQF